MLNKIFLMGRLTRDPELRYTQSQTPVASFSIACDHDYVDANGNRGVDFFDIVAWRHKADFVSKYFQKGSPIVVVGRLQAREWTDRDGNKRRSLEVIAEDVYFAGKKTESTAQPAARTYSDEDAPPPPLPPLPPDLEELAERYPDAVSVEDGDQF